ncbi:MAG: hypothetical protein H6R25_2183 [Proteobacteria bacterium]|nr:hypothetical protein [Pseudomonadota bacterium]
MYLTEEILEKLNAGSGTNNFLKKATGDEKVTLADIMVRSFAEVKALAGDTLTWGEKNFLYQQAQAELKENKMAESRILSRANPQLANAVRLGIRQSSMLGSYDGLFPARASSFVKPGSVASMFSPAGYLTELYREARGLHTDASPYSLDKRRPDLASLVLSQSNMDDEVSTLALSNELLLNNIQTHESKSYDNVMEMLATYRQTGATPFSLPYEATRQAIMLQDAEFNAFRNNPAVVARMDPASLLSIQADISPELREILVEDITEDNTDALIKKNFGENASVAAFRNIRYLSRYYGLTYDEMASLLGLVTAGAGINPSMQLYKANQLVSLINNEEGELSTVLIRRTSGGNSYQFGYAELVPTGVNNYFFNFTIVDNARTGSMQVGTNGYGSKDIFSSENFDVKSGVPISLPVTLSDEQIKKTVNIGVTRLGGGYYAHVNYDISSFPFDIFLLKLNKLIRLYKATGIAPSDILAIIESNNSDLSITEDVLSQLFRVNYYMRCYGIDVSAALVLAGASVGRIAHDNQASAFTRLFNTPMLNGTEFSADGSIIKLAPAEVTDTFRTGVMKRAFGVSDTELYTLWMLVRGRTPGDFACTIDNLSALYRLKLLADVNDLSVTGLAALLSVSPYASVPAGSLSGTELSTLAGFTDQHTRWLKEMNWTVSDLYLMLTDRFSTTLSPDIENLVTTLKNGLSGQDLRAEEAALITAVAPFIAATMQLDSAETAAAILQWLSQLKPQDLTVAAFLALVDKNHRTDNETASLVSWCQVMGQLALFVRNTGLSSAELAWTVNHPTVITRDATVLNHDIGTLYDLAQLHALLARCGTCATEILTSLSGRGSSKNNLTVKTVAMALNLDEQALTQALAQCSGYTYFYNWAGLRGALQWMDVAATLHITPADVAALIKLTPSSPYAEWVATSHVLQAGLNTRQTGQLQCMLEEATSAAASAYVIKNIAPEWATDRDSLYNWLLIDNQVSAQIKTTRIAEATASVQLYVNRALSDQEEGSVNAVKSKDFFTRDWDAYNKRYSTWAGVSELVYYPENYVDPTLRTGQTGMMDEMLQTLSQSQLTVDTVEDAFKTYMTRFEDIANLDVISGYHDGLSDKVGTTYILGRSAIGDYYWRSANIEQMSDGKLPASAWTEWKKITVALTPVNNLVRPVIFQSRLYLVWVESREVSTTNTNGSTASQSVEYLLKYAHILHDGTWSAPVTVASGEALLPLSSVADIDDTGMYCAKDADLEKLYVYFYKKAGSYKAVPPNTVGLILTDDGKVKKLTVDDIAKRAAYVYQQMDTTGSVMLNTPVSGKTTINMSGAPQVGCLWGDGYYTILSGGSVKATSVSVEDNNAVVNFNAVARVVYNGYAGTRSRTQVDMIKSISSIGDTFYLPNIKRRASVATASGRDFECIFTKNYQAVIRVLDDIKPISGDRIYGFNSASTDNLDHPATRFWPSVFNVNGNTGKQWISNDGAIKLQNYFYAYMSPGYRWNTTPVELMFGDFKKINTNIKSWDVKLTVNNEVFTADGCSKYSLDESLFRFNGKSVSVPLSDFSNNKAEIVFTLKASAPAGDGRSLGSETFKITLTRVDESNMPLISLNKTAESAQYLQYGAYRIRVNTLFAKQLVARANQGLNSILSMETQQLPEPKLGTGSYVDITIPAYDKNVHGNNRKIVLKVANNDTGGNFNSKYTFWSGLLNDEKQSVTLFIPTQQNSVIFHFPFDRNAGLDLFLFCEKGEYLQGTFVDINGALSLTKFSPIKDHSDVRDVDVYISEAITEPMDFSGANALYFWEMFYYVPMMVFKRLLSENQFTEATRWLKYIWNPDGYLVHGQPAPYTWNVRPLEDDTTWHANPLDSVDPDAVAQADPMHYKVATFMSYLDLLIARGDTAYRQLERDTLNEAKMWYVQALDTLGGEPYLSQDSGWSSPRLTDAADKTTQSRTQQALMAVRQQVTAGELRTANSLTALFLPQQNAKLAGYWQTLAQRLYNLRHNLSIDGNPLSLPVYAAPADPAALLSAAVMASQGGRDLPAAVMPLYRFPVMLESARGMVSQLTQFGSTLLSITERQDAEALSELLQTQGSTLVLQSIALQNSTLSEIDADKAALEESRVGALSRLDSYTVLYDEDVNTGEKQAMDLALSASVLSTTATVSYTVAAGLDAVPNIYGMAFGGSRYGSIARAVGTGIEIGAAASRTAAERISQSEMYRRRRQEWEIQRNAAQSEVKQIDAQLASLAIRREGAVLQKTYLETQQAQTQAQMTFLQNKFTSKALYNWLRGKLAAIYYQFYDLTVSRCLMAQEAYKWDVVTNTTFIRPGAWQGTYAGLMAGETLMLNLAQMEQEYLKNDQREKEVTRTVCLSAVYAGLSSDAFSLADQVVTLVTKGTGEVGTGDNTLKLKDKQLQATLKLSDLNIYGDYPDSLGKTKRIKQISVTLPALVGPYQDVRAVLRYDGSVAMPRGCDAVAVSHGMNDSGQFQLDFNDSRWLPFEGIPVNDAGMLTLSFPQADSSQKDLLLSLTDIILHIRYTIIS